MFEAKTALLTWIAVVLVSVEPAVLVSTAAQTQAQAPAATLPPDDELDALLAARKWNDLGAALSQAKSGEPIVRMMTWLQTRLNSGGGSLLGFLYAKHLWGLGNAQKIDDPNRDPRVLAGVITLYTYELIAIDGAKCADRSAPAHRADQLFQNNAPAIAYLKAKPEEVKTRAVELAIALEKRTTPLRKVDDLLCRDGLEQMRAGIEAGKTHEVEAPGRVGRTIAVEAPTGYEPRFLAPEAYTPAQERARSDMKANLLKLVQ